MLQSSVVVDLPSAEIRRAPRPSEWVRSLFGAEASPGSGREELTISAVTLISSLHRAFLSTGVGDAVNLRIDGRAVWTDPHDRPDDLERMWAQVRELGVLDRPFEQMSLLLARRWQDLFFLFDLRISRTVVLGEAEMVIEVYARPDVAPRPGDAPRAAWDRAYAWFADPDALDRARVVVAAQVHALRAALVSAIPDCTTRVEPARVVLVRPSADEVQALVAAPWPWASVARWRLDGAPAAPRPPDPVATFWDDAGFVLVRTAAVVAMLQQPDSAGRRPGVIVVDAAGGALFDGDAADDHAEDPWAGRWLQVDDAGLRLGGARVDDDFDPLPDDALVPLIDRDEAAEDAPTAAPTARRDASRIAAEPTWSPPDNDDWNDAFPEGAPVGLSPRRSTPEEAVDDPPTAESTLDDVTVDTNFDDPFDDWADLVELRSDTKHLSTTKRDDDDVESS